MAAGHPVIFVGSGEDGPTIVADNAGGIRAAMQHLIEHGHQRIAFIAGTPEDLGGDSGDRLRAYQAAVRDFQLADEEPLDHLRASRLRWWLSSDAAPYRRAA